jgi:hypothetical protein
MAPGGSRVAQAGKNYVAGTATMLLYALRLIFDKTFVKSFRECEARAEKIALAIFSFCKL